MSSFPKELAAALFKVQASLHGVRKDGTNPHFKSKYATLENVIDTIKPALQAEGVLFIQAPGTVDEHGVMQVVTLLVHAKSGEAFTSSVGVPLAKRDPQAAGSAITYACRYSLMALLGLPPVDDDAESATRGTNGNGTATLAKKDANEIYKKLQRELQECQSTEQLKLWMDGNKSRIKIMPEDFQNTLRLQCTEMMDDLRNREAA